MTISHSEMTALDDLAKKLGGLPEAVRLVLNAWESDCGGICDDCPLEELCRDGDQHGMDVAAMEALAAGWLEALEKQPVRCEECACFGEWRVLRGNGCVTSWDTCLNESSPVFATRAGLDCLGFGCTIGEPRPEQPEGES